MSVMDDEGAVVPLSDNMRAKLEETVTAMASTGLRTLCLTAARHGRGHGRGQRGLLGEPA